MSTDFHNIVTAKINTKFAKKDIYKFPSHLKCVATRSCKMQTFKNNTNCAETTVKLHYVKLSHTFNQLSILSQHLL